MEKLSGISSAKMFAIRRDDQLRRAPLPCVEVSRCSEIKSLRTGPGGGCPAPDQAEGIQEAWWSVSFIDTNIVLPASRASQHSKVWNRRQAPTTRLHHKPALVPLGPQQQVRSSGCLRDLFCIVPLKRLEFLVHWHGKLHQSKLTNVPHCSPENKFGEELVSRSPLPLCSAAKRLDTRRCLENDRQLPQKSTGYNRSYNRWEARHHTLAVTSQSNVPLSALS